MQKPILPQPGSAQPWIQAASLAAILWVSQPRSAKAEDSLTYKFSNYAETDHRIRVNSNYVLGQVDFGLETNLKVMGVTDSIAGATPTGAIAAKVSDPVPTAYMHDYRRAVNAELSHQFKLVNLDVGYGMSTESDFVSRGWSINTVTDLNQKNTRLLLGFAGTNDTIKEPILGWTSQRHKQGGDFIVGVTQVTSPDNTLSANLTIGRQSGYLNDPYKIVSTTMLSLDPGYYYTVPENRPDTRQKQSLLLGANHNFADWDGALDASYRLYHDSFGITAHTVSVGWLQNMGDSFIVEPSLRYYFQGAADFYHYSLDQAKIVTSLDPGTGETGNGRAPYYSSDYRLSRMRTLDVGIKLTWKVTSHLKTDLAVDSYSTHGLDHVTPQGAYAQARIITTGIQYLF